MSTNFPNNFKSESSNEILLQSLITSIITFCKSINKNIEEDIYIEEENHEEDFIEKIKNIKNEFHMYNYIMKHPNHVHYCMVWASWEAFTLNLVRRLVESGLFDPRQVDTAYDTDNEKGNCFFDHCIALCNELEDLRQCRRMYPIICYIKNL